MTTIAILTMVFIIITNVPIIIIMMKIIHVLPTMPPGST